MFRKLLIFSLLILLVITSICFTGCKHNETGQRDVLKETEDGQQVDTAQEVKEVPEEVFIAVDRHWAGPVFEGGVAPGTCVYEPLIFLNEKLEVKPGLATSWERVEPLK